MLLSAGLEPPQAVHVHGFLLVGGEKMSKTRLNQIAPATLVEAVGVDGVPLPLPRRPALRPRRRVHLRGHGGPLQRRPGQQPGQPGGPGGRGGRLQVRRGGPGAGPAEPPGRGGRPGLRRGGGGLGAGGALRGARSDLAPDPRGQRLPRGPRALEDGARPGGGRRSSATPWRCCASSPCWPPRPCPGPAAEVWSRIGLPGSPEEQRLPAAAAWGGYPGGLPVRKGPPLFPRLTV